MTIDDISVRPKGEGIKTAVLFIVFNRISTTRQVFQAIKKARPPRLYIASDGPREGVNGDLEKIEAIREYLIKEIDWKCDLKLRSRERNLGCGSGPSDAIDWFFKNEEMGIILEDDCLPSQSFFIFVRVCLISTRMILE